MSADASVSPATRRTDPSRSPLAGGPPDGSVFAPRGIERSTIDRTTRAQIGRVTALLRKRAVDPMTLELMRVQDEARNKPPFNAPPFTNIVFTTKLPAGAWAFIAQNTSRPTGAKPA